MRVYGDWRSRGATEWRHSSRGPYHIPTSTCFVYLLNRFARWIGLPDHDGKAWHLTTHQGRRTFAHFAALRDRSALFALAQHFGHRDYATTERGYVGNDYALDREIHGEILEQSVSAWEHMLSVPTLGGRRRDPRQTPPVSGHPHEGGSQNLRADVSRSRSHSRLVTATVCIAKNTAPAAVMRSDPTRSTVNR